MIFKKISFWKFICGLDIKIVRKNLLIGHITKIFICCTHLDKNAYRGVREGGGGVHPTLKIRLILRLCYRFQDTGYIYGDQIFLSYGALAAVFEHVELRY